MLKKFMVLMESLMADGVEDEPQMQTHMAAALLMFEISRADYDVDEAELGLMNEALCTRFGLDPAQAAEVLEQASRQSEQTLSLHPLVRLLNEHFTQAQKIQVIEDMWRVAYADGRLDKYEEYQIRRIADLLYVAHGDFIRAKHRAVEHPLP